MSFEDEFKLIKFLKDGDEKAWRHLIEHYVGVAWSATFRYNLSLEDREEIVQETFFRLVKSITNYNPDKSSLPTFLTIITKRVCIDKFRKDKTRINTLYDLKKSFNESSSEKGDDKQKMIDRLREVLKELPREKRLVIYLFYFNRCSYRRIAEIMNRDCDWVKNTLHRTRNNLEQILQKRL